MAVSLFVSFVQFLSLALFVRAAPSSLRTRDASAPIQFAINLTWAEVAPAGGSPRGAILTNGTLPGPPLYMSIGDTVEFTVYNNMPNATTIHFHGITQLNTPWSDGVPGVSQSPIQPGGTFLYTWTADEAGVYFYHAHERGQIQDGLYGAIVIQPRDTDPKPFQFISNYSSDRAAMRTAEKSLQTLFISDWSAFTSSEFYAIEEAGNIDFACADAILVNGMGSQYCLTRDEITAMTTPQLSGILSSANPPQLTDKACLPSTLPATQGNYTFDVAAIPPTAYDVCTPTTGQMYNVSVDPANKYAALTFINTGGFEILKLAIDSHQMWVYAVDGQYIQPQLVDTITVPNGERYSVMVPLTAAVGTYTIRVANEALNQIISGYANLVYAGSTGPAAGDTAVINTAGANTTVVTDFNDGLAAPYPPVVPATEADATYNFLIEKEPLGAWSWTLSGVEPYNISAMEDATPLLLQQPSAVPNNDLIVKTKIGQWVDFIVQVAGPIAQPHPLHKHSNKGFIIGEGVGPFPYTTVAEAQAAGVPFNFQSPVYRDGFITLPAEGNSSWMAIRYQVLNPGAFLFHCHIQTHLSGGMAVAVMDGVDQWPSIPAVYTNGGNGVYNGGKSTAPKKGSKSTRDFLGI